MAATSLNSALEILARTSHHARKENGYDAIPPRIGNRREEPIPARPLLNASRPDPEPSSTRGRCGRGELDPFSFFNI